MDGVEAGGDRAVRCIRRGRHGFEGRGYVKDDGASGEGARGGRKCDPIRRAGGGRRYGEQWYSAGEFSVRCGVWEGT